MELDQNFTRKRRWSFIIVLGFLFFGGCEYVIILPTAWDYLQTLGVTQEYWLGFTLSVYSFSAAISGIVGGRLSDVYPNHTKAIVIASLAFRSLGNFQYMLGFSIYNILCARLLCGLGAAAGTALMAEVCRTTRVEERTVYLSISNATFQLGILVGPGLQFILSYCHFSLFNYFEINILNAPGLFLGFLWLTYWIATVLLFENLSDQFQEQERRCVAQRRNSSRMQQKIAQKSASASATPSQGPIRASYKQYMDEFMTDTFILLLSLVFILFFSQVAIETIIPVVTQDFGYGVYENTYIYMAGGLEALIVYFIVAFTGKCVRETTMLVIGWAFILIALIWLLFTMPYFEEGNASHMAYFIIGVVVIYLGNPIVSVSSATLSSKVLSNETQGLGQGVRRLVTYVGLIFGPSWAGSTIQTPELLLGVTIAVMLINGVMLAVSFKNLRKAERNILDEGDVEKNSCDESTPLLKLNGTHPSKQQKHL